MASAAEQIARDAREHSLVLRSEFDALRDQVRELELLTLRERVKVLEERLTDVAKSLEQLKPTKAEAEEMGALKNRLTQLEEQKKLGDSRAFQFIVLFIGGLLTLAINVALLFLKQ